MFKLLHDEASHPLSSQTRELSSPEGVEDRPVDAATAELATISKIDAADVIRPDTPRRGRTHPHLCGEPSFDRQPVSSSARIADVHRRDIAASLARQRRLAQGDGLVGSECH